ncbi:unnamed protein product [Brassica oleracea]
MSFCVASLPQMYKTYSYQKFDFPYFYNLIYKKEKLAEIKSGLDEADVLVFPFILFIEYKSDLNQSKKDFKRVSSPDANQSTREELRNLEWRMCMR